MAKGGEEISAEADMVSVVIPCYNHAQFLGEAIESVLAQSYSNFEIIVVNDGSTDSTADVVTNYSSVRYVYQGNAGLSCARNIGLRHSRGEFLVFLDADDRLLPEALNTGVSYMREHPNCAFVSGHCRIIDSSGAVHPAPRQLRIESEHYLALLRAGTYIWCPATVLYRRRVFDFVHGFDSSLNAAADYDIYLRITRDFPVYSHGCVIAEYRQHSSNMSRDASKMANVALAAHDAQWNFVKANARYREAYDAGSRFWQNDYPFQKMVNRIREIVREQLPSDAILAVATGGSSELLRLDGRRARHFPEAERSSKGELFAQAASGSVTTPAWIEAGMAYEFSLYGGSEFSKLLARLLVTGTADQPPLANSEQSKLSSNDGVLLAAIPNPVPAAEEPGATKITWNTGNGSEGRVYVSGAGVYAGHDPIDSHKARFLLERARGRGAQYLLIPAKSFWWLDRYKEFRDYVETDFPTIVRVDGTCVIFDLRASFDS